MYRHHLVGDVPVPVEEMSLLQLENEQNAYETLLLHFPERGFPTQHHATKHHIAWLEELIKQRKLENLLKGE